MKLAVVIISAIIAAACATYYVGESYPFAGEIERVYEASNKTVLLTDKGKLEFNGQCTNATEEDKVQVQLIRDMIIIDSNQKFWTLESCAPMKADN